MPRPTRFACLMILSSLAGCKKAESHDARYQNLAQDIHNRQQQLDLEIANGIAPTDELAPK